MIGTNIGFLTYNINYSRRAVNEYEEYSWENRRSSVYAELRKIVPETNAQPDLIFLQEVLSQNRQEVEGNLPEYQWHFEGANARDGVCSNGIGIRKTFGAGERQRKFSYNFNGFDKTAEKVLGVVVGDICLINAHFPMEESGRMAMAEHFKACIPVDRDYRLIIAGDFNSFPDAKGPEQIELVRKSTGTVCISDAAISESTSRLATRSFKAYPYDKVPETALAMPGKLDHILVKGFQNVPGSHVIVLDASKVPNKSFSPSDHYAMRAVLK